jgi:AraC family transcriptional regulator
MLSDLVAMPRRTTTIAFPRGRLALRAMPASAGLEHVESPNYSWDGLKRGLTPFAVIQHTVAGRGVLEHEGRRYGLAPGDTMVVTIPHAHRYFLPPDGDWTFFFLVVSGQEALRLAGAVTAIAGPVLRPGGRAIDRLAECVRRLLDGEIDAPGEASALAYRALMALVDDVSAAPAGGLEGQPAWMLRVADHVEAHPGGQLTVERLANLAGLSRAHFVRQFSRLTGTGPADYVFRSRMARAARLLQASQLSVAEIARSLGFADPNYFAKAFRRAFEVSPTEFRRSGLFAGP